MADVTVVYWRDIPAQIIVGKGRRGTKVQLSERFEQAIDRAAMKSGAAGTDDYLADWRKAAPYQVDGVDGDVASTEAARLEAEYDKDRLIELINNDGRA
ncbi:virulence factor [Octadecabacter sp. CECT 8868]|uniref:virulence factor n=1 Tax=Octadecabacter algicola TaxID=2909342 RepID=UPI001F27B8EF|nr:virulence factor [Octadecabacter algicola]MCF2904044.1 virulence factor [Octadecabacter algicola]